MVSTRNHPREFPAPATPRTPHSITRSVSPQVSTSSTTSLEVNATRSTLASNTASPASPTNSATPWQHTPSQLTLLWLCISLPLVIWDTGYVLLRPHSMPGGALHWPLWKPYALYGQVDYFYGWPALEARDGFTGAQGWLNAVETVGYLWYLWVVWRDGAVVPGERGVGKGKGRGAPSERGVLGDALGSLTRARKVGGKSAALAPLVGFGVSVMTLSKTVLYWLNEACSGFEHVGHNSWTTLFFLWIIPNGLWLIFPTYTIYVFGSEIVQGLEAAGTVGKKKR